MGRVGGEVPEGFPSSGLPNGGLFLNLEGGKQEWNLEGGRSRVLESGREAGASGNYKSDGTQPRWAFC